MPVLTARARWLLPAGVAAAVAETASTWPPCTTWMYAAPALVTGIGSGSLPARYRSATSWPARAAPPSTVDSPERCVTVTSSAAPAASPAASAAVATSVSRARRVSRGNAQPPSAASR